MSTLRYIAYLALSASFAVSTSSVADPIQHQLLATGSSSSCPSESACKRSIWDILWTSFTVIFVCSWVAVHPHIAQDTKWWRRPLIRLELMVWSLISPELIVLLATKQYIAARHWKKFYQDREWTMTHAFFLQMGGFMLYDRGVKRGVLSPDRFTNLLKTKRITFPNISEEEIQDRSKGDGLSKGLVILQTSWFIIQIAARKLQGLAITQLEVATSSFAALNGVTYIFWWSKPLNVNLPIRIDLLVAPKTIEEREYSHSVAPKSSETAIEPKLVGTSTANISHTHDHRVLSRIVKAWDERYCLVALPDYVDLTLWDRPSVPIFFSSLIDFRLLIQANAIAAAVGLVFGAIHLAAWNFEFPSAIEARLWRIASVLIVVYPSLFFIPNFIESLVMQFIWLFSNFPLPSLLGVRTASGMHVGEFCLYSAFLALYSTARVFILVESFLALRNLPLTATSTIQWIAFLPHI